MHIAYYIVIFALNLNPNIMNTKKFKDVIKHFIADVLINESYDFLVDWQGKSCSIYVSFIPSYALAGLMESSQSIADISIHPSNVIVADDNCIEILIEPIEL